MTHKFKNQKIIQIKRARPMTQTISFSANKEALRTLSANGYALYMYLVLHPHNTIWALSSKAIYAETSLTQKPYLAAVKELISKGYLVPHDIDETWKAQDDAYYFYEDLNSKPCAKMA